jgi:tetratricopeptide (TPR) repeat protein
MADIFLSFDGADLRQRPVFNVLERDWSLWWAKDLRVAKAWPKTWARYVDAELAAAKCIVVIWSRHSIESSSARYHARQGQERGCLLPIIVDDVVPEPGFQQTPPVDLSAWDGSRTDARLAEVAAAARRVAGEGTRALRRGRLPFRFRQQDQIRALAGSASQEARDHHFRAEQHSQSARKDCTGAIADCTRLIGIEPGFSGGYSLRGLARLRQKDYLQAIADFDRAIGIEGEDCHTYYSRGMAYYRMQQWDAAIADFSRAVDWAWGGGGLWRYYLYRARACEDRGASGDRAHAEIDYLRSLEASPRGTEAQEALRRLCGDQNRPPDPALS